MTANLEYLKKDEKWFETHRQELLEKHKGKWIAVHNEALVGVYDSFSEAFTEGTEKTQSEQILVRQVTEADEPMELSVNITLGLLHAPLTT